jgi:hypothetical protein
MFMPPFFLAVAASRRPDKQINFVRVPRCLGYEIPTGEVNA